MGNIKNKKYIQKVCGLVYRQFLKKENIDITEMADDYGIYEDGFNFLHKSLGHDFQDTDFLYACAYLNIAKWGDKILTINPEQITIVPKKRFKGESTHYKSVRVDEYYSYDTYMDIMLEYEIRNWNIEPDDTEEDTRDTWDWEINITTDKNSK